MIDQCGVRIRATGSCSPVRHQSIEGVEVHAHCGVLRRKRISQVLLITPGGGIYVVPEMFWEGNNLGFFKELTIKGWIPLVNRIREYRGV